MSAASIQVEDLRSLNYRRELVWSKLNDPVVLADCIRGCHHVERESRHSYRAVIVARIGEIKKQFHVDLRVDDAFAPGKYTLSTQMSAGVFGRVTGKAEVTLRELSEAETSMAYSADISGTGVLARVLPLAEGIVRRRVQEFLDEFVGHLAS